jgi:hypothetical protein
MLKRSSPQRRGVILLIVLALLTLFAILGLTFVYYASAAAGAARLERESLAATRPDADPELLLAHFLGQLLYDAPDDETGVYSALRGHSLARNLFGYKDGANDVPFNGTGRLHFPGPLGKYDDELINYTYFATDAFLRDPERLGLRSGLQDKRAPFAGGFNAPYTYPDLNNLFLAAVKAGPLSSQNASEGTVLLPSFHRPWLFGRLTDRNNPNWSKPEGKYLLLRPRPTEMGPGFPYPEDEGGDVKNLPGGPGYYDPFTKQMHANDSVWIDLDFPVLRTADGRKYKPLFAPLIVDLDNRVNLNVHGNVRGRGYLEHASNTGRGAWEVNPSWLSGKRNTPEWPDLLKGDGRHGGRYGLTNQPHSPQPAGPFVVPRFYAPTDFDASDEKKNGRPSDRIHLPGSAPTAAFWCFPEVPAGYGDGDASERKGNPNLFNPLRPTAPDRLLGLGSLEGLLRYGDTGTEALDGELFRLCPNAFRNPSEPAGSAKRRQLVTLHSFDTDRPGVTPWFRPGAPNFLKMSPDSLPAGSAVAPPSLSEFLVPQPQGEFGSDGRTAAAVTALRRLDLNRHLPDYPNPDANGRITDLVGFNVAQTARQHFAAEIFERLWQVTGAGNPYDPAVLPPPGAAGYDVDRWNALRWLAQLAANIVDFIDSDDYSTPFNWYPAYPGKPSGEWVFGTELPRVLLNEAYVEYANDPADKGLLQKDKRATKLKANVWVELHNPFKDDPPLTAPWRRGAARLEMPESGPGTADGYAVYRLIIAPLKVDIRQPDNVTGDPPGAWSVVSRFTPEPDFPALASVDTRLLLPANTANRNGYFGPPGSNEGFYVLGPALDPARENDPFPQAARDQPLATLRRPEMSYLVDAIGGNLPAPSLLLQRLACPHLPPNPLPGRPVDPTRPLNPYLTVDYLRDVTPNYAALIGVDGPDEPPVKPVRERFSVGKRQPYAAHPSQLKPQAPKPAAGDQPRHTFFRHNADQDTPGPNVQSAPPSYPPFDWLVHLDRPLVSPMELLHVSAYKPHELTQEFINPQGKLKPFNHRAPWFDEDLKGANPPQSHRLYRALEFLTTHNETVGMMQAVTTSPKPVASGSDQVVQPREIAGVTASGGTWRIEPGTTLVLDQGKPNEEAVRVKVVAAGQFSADFLRPHAAGFTIRPTTISERVPGKINLNTVWDEETFLALCDPQPSNGFNEAVAREAFKQLQKSRTVKGEAPGPGDKPFHSLSAGLSPVTGDALLSASGLPDTLLRANENGDLLLSVPSVTHPTEKYELLTKIFNNTTVRSNVFAVWVTVGFFEVTDDTTRPVKLGAEVGRAEGRHVRHRMFAIVDRSVLTANPGPRRRFDLRADPSPGAPAGRVVPYISVIE